jgi:predicted aminopeptidase
VAYGFRQAKGQLTMMSKTEPIEVVLKNTNFPDSLKARIRLIQEIKRFAEDSLGLRHSENYETFYDQGGKPIIWTVTACKPFALEAKTWDFPLIGSFSYRGHFDEQRTKNEADALQQEGYDTQINEVSAWSTLGWLKDPILSSMLNRSEGSLAALIIHELTHGTLFTGDDLTFNENLADFVGDYGAIKFLEFKYGKDSPQYKKYAFSKQYYAAYTNHLVKGSQKLDSLYHTFQNRSLEEKKSFKTSLIEEIVVSADTLLGGKSKSKRRFTKENLPNNAYFIGFLTYRSKQNQFEEEFKQQFKGDFKRYFQYLVKKYG